MKKAPEGVFKPKPTSGEMKTDATSRAALAIIEGERTAREAKTERLRLARLAQEEAATEAVSPKERPRQGKRKATA